VLEGPLIVMIKRAMCAPSDLAYFNKYTAVNVPKLESLIPS
jgi:hypothetical protein